MRPSPICVGGVGGSGTRVLAEIVQGLGVHLGHARNDAQDNLWFHRMFVRRPWTARDRQGKTERLQHPFALFERVSTHPTQLGRSERRQAVRLAAHSPYLKKRRALRVDSRRLLAQADDVEGAWGWKEPNTHMYLPAIAQHWPEAKYIHLVRNGLDMASSTNSSQVRRWGPHFGLTEAESHEASPRASLRVWVAANQQALGWCTQHLGGRHIVVRFEDLCFEPRKEVERVAAFVGVRPDERRLAYLASLPSPPASIDRYQENRIQAFPAEDVQAVRDMGYEVGRAV